jgi:hypothetical protein
MVMAVARGFGEWQVRQNRSVYANDTVEMSDD